MKYKTRTGKVLSDQNFISDIGEGTKDLMRASPSAIGNFFIALFNYFIGVSAFISRSFLRAKLGERTFGIITVISVYLIIWFIFMFPMAFEVTGKEVFGNYSESSFGIKLLTFFLTFFYLPLLIFLDPEIFQKIVPEISQQVHLFVLVIIIIGIGHLIEMYTRRINKEVIHSFYRGNSLLFGWLEGKEIFGHKIKPLTIWMIIEPLFVVTTAFLVQDFLGYKELAVVLYFSACCLFIEEFRVYQENRRFILDMLDGQLDAAFVRELQQEYRGSLENIAKKERPRDYKASLKKRNSDKLGHSGSDSQFRAKVL